MRVNRRTYGIKIDKEVLANRWSNSQLQRIQAVFNPVLVADEGYWTTHENSSSLVMMF